MKVIKVSRPWWAILRASWVEVQLSPSLLHTQPQALIATDTPRELDATGAWSWVRVLAEKRRKSCTDFITMVWLSTWETGSIPQAEDQKAADCGRVWNFHTTFCTTARSHPPFVPCRILHYKQANDFQVQLGYCLALLKFPGPFFSLPHSAGSQPTCPEFSWTTQNPDSPLFPLLWMSVGEPRIG